MDCDDVMLLLAQDEAKTLTGRELASFDDHCAGCEVCERLRCNASAPSLPEIARDQYEIEGVIAAGGMGRILAARDRRIGRRVAIKEVLSETLRVRFEREAIVTARLQHPAIVPVYEVGTWPDGAAFYTMRLIPGHTLMDAIHEAESLDERLALLPRMVAVTEALAYAHRQGVIHRDLKPQNVVVGEHGETVVIDWGLAKVLDAAEADSEIKRDAPPAVADPHLTSAGEVLGTPPYMAPEQVSALAHDERTDVYALGAMLYSLLSGVWPYQDTSEGATSHDILALVAERAPTPLTTLVPGAPRDLVAIVERAMARDREDRYPSAAEMSEELRRFLAGKLVTSHDYSAGDLIRRWVARHRPLVATASLAVVALAAIGIASFLRVNDSRQAEKNARLVAEDARDHAVAARKHAERARARAEARADELVFLQAVAALESDPTRAIALLKRYPQDGPRAQSAALIAAEARTRGLYEHVLAGPSSYTTRLQFIGPNRLLAAADWWDAAQLWELDAGTTRRLPNIERPLIGYDPETDSVVAVHHSAVRLVFERTDGSAATETPVLGELFAHQRPVDRFAWSEEARLGALGVAEDRTVIWDATAESALRPTVPGYPAAFTRAGELLVLEEKSGRFTLWNTVEQRVEGTVKMAPLVQKAADRRVSASTAPGIAAFAVRDDVSVQVWSSTLARVLRVAPPTAPTAMQVSADGGHLAVAHGESVSIWSLSSGQQECRFPVDAVATAVQFSPTAPETLAVGTATGDVIIGPRCGPAAAPTTLRLRGAYQLITALGFSPDGSRLAVASQDHTVRVHRVGSQESQDATLTTGVQDRSHCADTGVTWMTAHGRVLWLECHDSEGNGHLSRTDVSTRKSVGWVLELPEGGRIGKSLLFLYSEDGDAVVTIHGGGTSYWRGDPEYTLEELEGLDEHAAITADGRFLYWPRDANLEVWDLVEKKRVESIPRRVTYALPARDRRGFLITDEQGLAFWERGSEPVYAGIRRWEDWFARWSKNGQTVVAHFGPGSLLLYDRQRRQWERWHVPGDEAIREFTVSPTGDLVATATNRGIYLWSPGSRAVHYLPTPGVLLGDLAFSEAGDSVTVLSNLDATVTFPVPRFDPSTLDEHTRAVVDGSGRVRSTSR